MALPKAMAANRFAVFAVMAAVAGFAVIIVVMVAARPETTTSSIPVPDVKHDTPEIREIYPSKEGGYEWHLNSTNPREGFTISPAAAPLYPIQDGTWQIGHETNSSNTGLRMYVIAPDEWQNVEMTGYVRLESHTFAEEFAWAVRSGHHTESDPCDGTAYYGALAFDGSRAWFQKEIFHADGGYTNKRYSDSSSLPVEPLKDRWVGIKMIAYNTNNGVKLELWEDDKADNNWVKIAETTDNGGWSAKVGLCGREADHVISEPRPRVTFRIDNATFEFKDFSVREIQPPS